MTFLSIRNISIRINNIPILSNICFDVREGEFFSIIGPSGCGKTTLLKILIGLIQPDQGTVIFDRKDITKLHPSGRGMGIIFQNYSLFQHLTVLENLLICLDGNNKGSMKKEKAVRFLERVGLAEHMYKKPYELSGGQQQRIAIARTIMLQPRVILYDEPLSALDVIIRMKLRDEIKLLQTQNNITTIYVTHDQEEAFSISDRIAVMSNTKIEQIGTPKEIFYRPANDFVASFVREPIEGKINSIIKIISEKEMNGYI